MKYMILVKATKDSEAGKMPTEALMSEMVGFHEEMAKAGVLVDGSGLKASKHGWRIKYEKGGKRTFVDGPFAETKELVAGYTIINVKSREEAIAWTKRFLEVLGKGECELRPIFEAADFAPGVIYLQRHSGAAIVPMAVWTGRRAWPRRRYIIEVGSPVVVPASLDLDGGANWLRHCALELYERARRRGAREA